MNQEIRYVFSLFTKINNTATAFHKVDAQVNTVNASVKNLQNSLNNKLNRIDISAIAENFERVGRAFDELSAPGVAFEESMAELSAITGIVGKDLDALGENARKVGVDSGLGASQAASAYKVLASQIDVAKIGMDGLNVLQQKTVTLSKASGMSIEDAALALSGTINQFGLDASEANRVINVLAAGSKYGAAEISELSQSFKVTGAVAKAAGLDVEATAGALEVLSKNNLKGAEAGTAMRNIILKMQTTLGVDFGKTSLSEALDDLKPKMSDAAYLSKVFGMENMAAVQFLVANASAVDEMTAKVTETSVAQEQANVRSNTMANRMAVIREHVNNLKIGFFNLTGGAIGYIGVMGEMMSGVANWIPVLAWLTKAIKLQSVWSGIVAGATKIWTGAQWLLNVAMSANPIALIIVGITALVGAIAWVCTMITGWSSLWEGVVGFMKFLFFAFVDDVKLYFSGLVNGIMIGLNAIMAGWYKFKIATGIGDDDDNRSALAKIHADTEARKKAITDGAKDVADNLRKAQDSLGVVDLSWKTGVTGATASKKGNLLSGGVSNDAPAGVIASGLSNAPRDVINSATLSGGGSSGSAGTRGNNITINVGGMSANIYAENMEEGAAVTADKILEMMLKVVNMTQTGVV